MKILLQLTKAELEAAVLDYIENTSNLGGGIAEAGGREVGCKIEFTYEYLNNNTVVDGARVVFDEKLLPEDK